MADIDNLVVQTTALTTRINELLQNNDTDVALAALAHLIGFYLLTRPMNEREAELEDWLRLVRKLAGIGETRQ